MARLSLRWRVASAFGLGSLLLTSALALATWNLASGYMLTQRQNSAVRQAMVNVRLINQVVNTGSEGLDELLTGLTTGPDASILLHQPGRWVSSGRQVDPAALPADLLRLARGGTAARQRVDVGGIPVLAVALPVGIGHQLYVELFPLLQLDQTFRFLSSLLIAGAVIGALLGFALGMWASKRALRPLRHLTAAAAQIAGGELSARLPRQADTDLAPLATTFNATAEALEQRVLRDARFASDVSHELRSPLTTMVNVAEVLHHSRAELPARSRQAVDILTQVLHGFRRMVVDLLEISSADQDPEDLTLEPVDVRELVSEVLAARPGIQVPIECGVPAPVVLGDRGKLDRVLANLVDNAVHHAGGLVCVGIRRVATDLRVEVDDAGPGVPVEQRERIFERFARGVLSGRRGATTGSGLGLALVAEHVARHGGSAWVEDRPGGGARFVVQIPGADR